MAGELVIHLPTTIVIPHWVFTYSAVAGYAFVGGVFGGWMSSWTEDKSAKLYVAGLLVNGVIWPLWMYLLALAATGSEFEETARNALRSDEG